MIAGALFSGCLLYLSDAQEDFIEVMRTDTSWDGIPLDASSGWQCGKKCAFIIVISFDTLDIDFAFVGFARKWMTCCTFDLSTFAANRYSRLRYLDVFHT